MFTKRGKENRERIYEYICAWSARNGYPPSIREICHGVGITSTKAVKYHIDALVDSGILRRHARQARALETAGSRFNLPLLGRIAAGQPILAAENVEENVTLERFQGCFLLRVKGDSMTGAAIMDSDMVIVQPRATVRSGEIVAALIDNEATVKRLRQDEKEVVLESDNVKYAPIRVVPGEREFSVLGRVVGVLRMYC
jgi:repressor LexA